MYLLKATKIVKAAFKKLGKKDPMQKRAIERKVKEILEDPYRFKPLRSPMQHLRRVHIMKSFVLIYSIDEKNKAVRIEDYNHHDNVYRR